MDVVLTDAERAIIDEHIEEIFEQALLDTIEYFMADSDFYNAFTDRAVEYESSIDGARELIEQDICEGEQYFYAQLEKKFENVTILSVKLAEKA